MTINEKMTQRIIKENLALFLDYKAEQWCKDIANQNLPPDITLVKQNEIRAHAKHLRDYLISGGKCFALSVADGAFSATGYGNWWKAILAQVATWTPKNFAALDQTIDLQHLLPANHKAPVRILTLENLFELVLNAVITEQAQVKVAIEFFLPAEIRQVHYFEPDKKLFELMINGELLQAQSRDIIGGFFTTPKLAILLQGQQKQLSGNICLIHAENHVINVQYDGKWLIYDSNYSHESIETMTKSFDTAEECVEEIKLCLKSEAVALELASFRATKPVKFDFFDKLNIPDIIQLLERGGLYVIAHHAPKQLQKIVELAFNFNDVATALSVALSQENQIQRDCLLVVARYAPDELEKLFILARENAQLALSIAKALTITNDQQWNAMHMMAAQSSPIESLLNLAKINKDIDKALRTTLSMKTKRGKTPLDHFSKDNPNFSKLFTFQLLTPLPMKSLFHPSNSEKKLDQKETSTSKILRTKLQM
ncbi:Uncharacterised protein [Legionella busanensis]|uniref:Uncharacterized protein n=1 Tax=Legionella busanensis TaxID=190655 RepID=A0A378JP70_9GAMM|nr:hypothetical protein [Legionella busanensis]STX52083.1 Uncharacterised protein [Legionella busanensis]